MSKKKPENLNNHHDLEVSNTIFFLQSIFINATMYRVLVRNLRLIEIQTDLVLKPHLVQPTKIHDSVTNFYMPCI